MKNTIKLSIALLIVLLAAVACRDEEAVRFPELQTGASARVFLSYPDQSYINIENLPNASVAFDVYTVNTDISELVYEVGFVDADSVEANFPRVKAITIPASKFVDGKATKIEITAAELVNILGIPGGLSYLEGEDSFVFSAFIKLTDGRIISAENSAPSITGGGAASFTTQFPVFVGCPSPRSNIEGTYESTMEFNNFGLGIGNKVEVTVTFVGPEPFRYRVTDHTAELYVPFQGTKYVADFYDLCGVTKLQPARSFGAVLNLVTSDPNFGSPVIDTSTPKTVFYLNWNETNNGILASVRFEKKIN